MSRVFVSAGWPYLYEIPGLHNCIPMLFADAVARARRLAGDEVVFTSGADEHGATGIADHDFTIPTIIVMGNETAGLSRAYRDACDAMVRVPGDVREEEASAVAANSTR